MPREEDEVLLTSFWVFTQSCGLCHPPHCFYYSLLGSLRYSPNFLMLHCVYIPVPSLSLKCLPGHQCGALYNCAFKKWAFSRSTTCKYGRHAYVLHIYVFEIEWFAHTNPYTFLDLRSIFSSAQILFSVHWSVGNRWHRVNLHLFHILKKCLKSFAKSTPLTQLKRGESGEKEPGRDALCSIVFNNKDQEANYKRNKTQKYLKWVIGKKMLNSVFALSQDKGHGRRDSGPWAWADACQVPRPAESGGWAQGAWPGEQQRATGNTGGRFHEQAFWDRIFVQQGTTFL